MKSCSETIQENHSFATDISVANPLQTYKNPLQISISNGFATEVFCCKKPCCNFAHFGIRLQKTNGFATELFRCYIATNFTFVANSVAKSQKLKDNEKAKVVVIPLQIYNRSATVSLQTIIIFVSHSVATLQQICNHYESLQNILL